MRELVTLGWVGGACTMALDPAVAAGVAVGCVVFLIVAIFVFIKVRARGFVMLHSHLQGRGFTHSHAHTHLRARANNVCVLLVDTVGRSHFVRRHEHHLSLVVAIQCLQWVANK